MSVSKTFKASLNRMLFSYNVSLLNLIVPYNN